MSGETENGDVSSSIDEQEDLPQATVISSDEFREPDIKAWQYVNLEKQAHQKEQKIRDDVIETLRKEVEPQIREQTTLIKRQAFEEAQKKGYDEGFQQGVKAGRLEGKSSAQKEADERLAPQVKSLQELAEFMVTPYQRISEQVFVQLASLSIEIAQKVVEKELDLHKTWVLEAVKKSVERLPNEVEPIEVHLNPLDKEVVDAYATEKRTNWVLVADDRILPGSCKVKQNASTLVNDWREQLTTIVEQTYAVAEKLSEPSSGDNADKSQELQTDTETSAISPDQDAAETSPT
ncbi:FliH/SctL family protein [Hydrogenovibrio kuenenii]|uniref:FliH/SctL family protein n=1 Tax=Hydrogenovibrio kuenenii TaxID=63658 RepID=UPI000467D544|nr:FliH/SctL family protein [Hydrogenovibrio kuenenii]